MWESPHTPGPSQTDVIFDEETFEALSELGSVLRTIHNRLIAEGYTIVDGHITKPETATREAPSP
jgi:hypothetical protein